jgi:hypothetical protein
MRYRHGHGHGSRITLAFIAAILLLAATGAVPVAAQGGDVDSGGIGLERAEWEDVHGPGNANQSYVEYEGGLYLVGFDGDVVTFIERGWEATGNAASTEAEDEVDELLPTDAQLRETFYAPPTAAGPIGLFFERYESDSLDDRLADATSGRTGGILVVYQQQQGQQIEPDVTRVSIAVGTAP